MEQQLSVLVALVLVSLCKGQEWSAPDFCHNKICPRYTLISKTEDFEERLYDATDWITTNIKGSQDTDVIAANSRLKDYCERQKNAGYEIPLNTLPVLITKTGDSSFSMSWFVPPGTRKPEDTDPLVKLQSRPKATVFVKVFGGIPSLKSADDNAKIFQQAMAKAGKSFDPHTYTGAGYDPYISVTYHNELWFTVASE